MKKIYFIFKVCIERVIKELWRYRFNTISNIASMYVLFMAWFIGFKAFGANIGATPIRINDTLEGFVVGYFLWYVMVMAYSDAAYGIVNDASRGTLEQLNMSNVNLVTIISIRSFANLIVNFVISIILLLMIMNTTNYSLEIKIMSILVPIFIGIFSILGIGLIFGGLALIFKKVQSLLNMVQFFLIGLIIVAPESKIIRNMLPFRPAANKVFDTMIGGDSLSDINLYDYGIMIGNSILYFAIGVIIFNQCVNIAKRKGVLGQY